MNDSILALILLAVLIACFSLQSVPMGVTAVLGSVAMALFGLMEFADVFRGFGSDIVMMVAGMIIVGNSLHETGLSTVLGNALMRIRFIRRNERLFLCAVLVIVSILHFFLTNTAIVAMFLPIVASVAESSQGRITKKNTYMAIGITAVVSGNATLISSTPQMAVQAILVKTEGVRALGFFELTRGAIPMILLSIFYFCTLGYTLGKKVFDFKEPEPEERGPEAAAGSTVKMVLCGLVFLLCMAGFVSKILPAGIISAIAAGILIITRCIDFPRAMHTMDWNALLVIAGALGFSIGLEKSGAIDLVSMQIMTLFGGEYANPYLVFGVLVIVASLLSTTMSNTATAVIMAPMAIAIAQSMGFNPVTFAIGIIFGCNYDFFTPIGTPPLTMTLSGGYRFTDYTKVGGLFNVIAIAFTIFVIPLVYGF